MGTEKMDGEWKEGNRVKAQPKAALQAQFPEHWGAPPKIQTKDLRPLPGGYGRGSSTLAAWVKNNMDADAQGRPQSRSLKVLEAEKRAQQEEAAEAEAQRQIVVAARLAQEKALAEEKLMGGGKGSYMDHESDWYRKWQFRKDYSDNRDKRYVRNYHMFKDPGMRRMQMQMMHEH